MPSSATTESWVEQIVTIPSAGAMSVGITWNTTVNGDIFYINEFEIAKLTPQTPEYQYFVKDHLGNTRITFTTIDQSETATATMETANESQEIAKFLNYNTVKKINSQMFDHTNGTSPVDTYNSVRLTGGTTTEKYGLARSLAVMPGDVVSMEVYAKYLDPMKINWSTALEAIIFQISGVTNPTGTFVEGQGGNGLFRFSAGTMPYGTQTGSEPKAYLNYLLFDKKDNLIGYDFKRVTTVACEKGQIANSVEGIAHERLFFDNITIKEPGLMYIYLSNENGTPVEVFFDDFKVTHTKSPVIQAEDYYPFGLTYNTSERSGYLTNRYLYNGKELQDELGLGWMDYGARMYMPEIGRWGVVDKLTDYYEGSNPYTYALNDPVNAIDPDGRLIVFVNGFMPDQYYYQDDHKTAVSHTDGRGVHTVPNTNYRPYPGERNLSNDAPTYLQQPFSYWGNETNENMSNIQSGIGGLFSQAYNDYNVLFTSASNNPLGSARKRFKEGLKAGEDLINQLESGVQFLANGETIKIVGHSQGAAYAAGMATFIAKHSKYSSRLEVVFYLAPDQPNQFEHPEGIKGVQFSTESDLVSSKGILALLHNSNYSRIRGVKKSHGRKDYNSYYRGHEVDTYLDDVATYFRDLGVNVTVTQ